MFVAETTGGHSYLIPSLIGAAVAYAISGEASVSGDQHIHETARIAELGGMTVRDVMRTQVVSVQADTSLRDFMDGVAIHNRHAIYPVYEGPRPIGTIAIWSLGGVPAERWGEVPVNQVTDRNLTTVPEDCDLSEALRLLLRENAPQVLLVIGDDGEPKGLVTKTDVLRAVQMPVASGRNSTHR